MNQVWKFEIDLNENLLQMPAQAQPLSVGFQGDKLILWALVDIEAPLIPRNIYVGVTGHNIGAACPVFIGTALKDNLVLHVFEDIT